MPVIFPVSATNSCQFREESIRLVTFGINTLLAKVNTIGNIRFKSVNSVRARLFERLFVVNARIRNKAEWMSASSSVWNYGCIPLSITTGKTFALQLRVGTQLCQCDACLRLVADFDR